MPKAGLCQEVTKTFLSNVAENNQCSNLKMRKERENIEKEAKNFLRYLIYSLHLINTKINI